MMKIKKILELYKELRRLRRKVKVLEADLHDANMRYNTLFLKNSAGRAERIKEIMKAYPDFGKGVGYKMSMVDELEKESCK